MLDGWKIIILNEKSYHIIIWQTSFPGAGPPWPPPPTTTPVRLNGRGAILLPFPTRLLDFVVFGQVLSFCFFKLRVGRLGPWTWTAIIKAESSFMTGSKIDEMISLLWIKSSSISFQRPHLDFNVPHAFICTAAYPTSPQWSTATDACSLHVRQRQCIARQSRMGEQQSRHSESVTASHS